MQSGNELSSDAEQPTPAPRRRRLLLVGGACLSVLLLLGAFALSYQMAGGNSEIVVNLPSAPPVALVAAAPGVAAAAVASEAGDEGLDAAAAPAAGATLFGPALPPAQYVARLPVSYTLPIRYGSLGPQLVEAGVIDLPAFIRLYEVGGKPLAAEQQAILREGSAAQVVIDAGNARFLLNFFWAVGLANRNAILLDGPMQQHGPEGVVQFSSTGGWTLAVKPIAEVYASLPLIELSAAQQQRLQAVAENVYRPCCGNSTAFPDCNHGMAMLGILELMAAGDASEDEMYTAAKYISAFWFPQDMTAAAAYFKLTQNLEFAAIDPRQVVGAEIFSSGGARAIRQWLADGGRLGEPSQDEGACGV